MHVSIEFQFVVADGELGRLAAHAPDAFGLAGELQDDALFKFYAIDGVREVDIEHRTLERWICRVLIKLPTRDFRDESGCLKLQCF